MSNSGGDCGISKSKREFFYENAGDVLDVSSNELPKHGIEEKLEGTNEVSSENLETNLQERTGTPSSESRQKYIPKDWKEEIILGLFYKMKSLKEKIQYRTDFANGKVMKSTRELSEAENEFSDSTDHFHATSSYLLKLEEEISILKAVAEASNLQALEIKSDLQETMRKDQEIEKRCESVETNIVSLEKEIEAVRSFKADLLSQLEAIRTRTEQLEVPLRRDEGGKRKCHEDALRKRNGIESLKSKAKEGENKMRKEAESFIQRCEEDRMKLKAEISERRSVSESTMLAAAGTGFSSSSITKLLASSHQEFEVTKKFGELQVNFGADCVALQRECIICMTQELCVVFLPCAHQILCSECNVLHEKQGLADCPSCRTPVQERILVQFTEQ